MKTLTHTLTGIDAATAMLLEEVQAIFHEKSNESNNYDAWRLEYYIMEVMCAAMNSSFEVDRDKIEKMVELCCSSSGTKKEFDTAFRRLVRGGFLYSKRGNRRQFQPEYGKVTRYALDQSKYDTKSVAA